MVSRLCGRNADDRLERIRVYSEEQKESAYAGPVVDSGESHRVGYFQDFEIDDTALIKDCDRQQKNINSSKLHSSTRFT